MPEELLKMSIKSILLFLFVQLHTIRRYPILTILNVLFRIFIIRIQFQRTFKSFLSFIQLIQIIMSIAHPIEPKCIFLTLLFYRRKAVESFLKTSQVIVSTCQKTGQFRFPFPFRNLQDGINYLLLLILFIPLLYLFEQLVMVTHFRGFQMLYKLSRESCRLILSFARNGEKGELVLSDSLTLEHIFITIFASTQVIKPAFTILEVLFFHQHRRIFLHIAHLIIRNGTCQQAHNMPVLILSVIITAGVVLFKIKVVARKGKLQIAQSIRHPAFAITYRKFTYVVRQCRDIYRLFFGQAAKLQIIFFRKRQRSIHPGCRLQILYDERINFLIFITACGRHEVTVLPQST